MNTLLTEPVTSPTARGENPTIPDATPTHRPTAVEPRARILYVDDEPQLRRLGQLVLVRSGYDVDTAADGAQGWEALQHAHYNLLITDHEMPRLTGLELATQARRAGMRLPIVMTSGSLNPLDNAPGARPDLDAFLPKPFAADVLVATVERVLCAANNLRQCSGTLISVVAHIALSTQHFPHGGINE